MIFLWELQKLISKQLLGHVVTKNSLIPFDNPFEILSENFTFYLTNLSFTIVKHGNTFLVFNFLEQFS